MKGRDSSLVRTMQDLRAEAVVRIIEEVKRGDRVQMPPRINVSNLSFQLETTWFLYEEAMSGWRTSERDKKQSELMEIATRLAEILGEEIEAETFSRPQWGVVKPGPHWEAYNPGGEFPPPTPPPFGPIEARQLHGSLEAFRQHLLYKDATAPDAPESNPKTKLISTDLALIYEKHFQLKPGTSRPPGGGEPYGPYVRFVQAVAAEFGTSFPAETIAAYARLNGKDGQKKS